MSAGARKGDLDAEALVGAAATRVGVPKSLVQEVAALHRQLYKHDSSGVVLSETAQLSKETLTPLFGKVESLSASFDALV